MLVIAIISQLLIMAGDVETNPGPKHRGETLVGWSQTLVTNETPTVLWMFVLVVDILSSVKDMFIHTDLNVAYFQACSSTCVESEEHRLMIHKALYMPASTEVGVE